MPALRWTRTGLEITQGTGPALLLGLLDNVLRGIGQVMFQNNSYSGLLFLLAVATQSWVLALALLLGSAAATLTAAWLGAEHAPIRMGMFGFNGGLVALALLVFLQPSALTWGCALLAAAASSVVMAAMLRTFASGKLPALTAPFVITTLCCFLAVARFGRLVPTGLMPTAELPQAAAVEGVVTLTTLLTGVFNGIGQVFFQGSVISGLLLLAGLLWASPRAGIAAVLGSAVGALVAWGMGAAEPAIRAGMYGYNSALVAIALSSVFLRPSAATYAYTLLAAAITPFVAAATMASLAPLGMPALTLPFVLVTWVFVLASTSLSQRQNDSTS